VKPVWLVAAAALAAFLIWRRRRLEPTLLAGGAIAVVVLAVYGTGLIHLPNLENLLIDVGRTLGTWTYLLVGALAFLETGAFIGLIAPGETAMLLGGLVAGQGQIDVITLIAIAWACAVAGDLTSFALGRRLGRAFLVRHGPKVHITEERLHTVEGFFARHGGKAILIGRFVGLVRAIAPFLAGSSGVPLRRFVPYDVIGAGLWSSTFIVLGYIFWQSFSTLVDYAKKGAFALSAVITLVVAIVWAMRWVRVPEHRDQARAWLERQGERPALRPVVRVLRPVAARVHAPARFVWERLTPGQLGLELTTLLAVALVGGFTFGAHVVKLDEGRVPFADDDVLRMVQHLEVGALTEIAKVIDVLGSLPVAAVVVGVACVLLAWRREWGHAAVLVAGLLLTYAVVQTTQEALTRPRPPDQLAGGDGSGYPSARAAYAMAWVAVAVVLSRVLPSLASRFAFVTVGIVLAAAVGLSEVYLRVGFLSDVTGGCGVAACLFAVCGMIALVVDHMRENVPQPA
jgi:membrane protein DedA with SNARE-associated domain/membrane-associated phospholipid phosphatase